MWRLIFLMAIVLSFTSCTFNKIDSSLFIDLAIKYDGSEYIGYKSQALYIKPISVPNNLKNCEINPMLPEGLIMNESTCEISGSSLVQSELRQYVITANSINGSQKFSLWLEIKSSSTDFNGFRYSQNDFSYKYPAPLFYITARYDSQPPEQCFTVPPLPQGISISSSCHISGIFHRALNKKGYVVNAVANNQIFTQNITIEAISGVLEDGLKLHFDARVQTKSVRDFKTGCGAIDSSTLQWENLALSSIKNLVLSGNGTPNESCIAQTGWYGDGTADDPYRWRNENSYMLSEENTMRNGNNYNFTLTVWVRGLSKEFMLYGIKETSPGDSNTRNEQNDFGYLGECGYSRGNTLQLFNKFYPFAPKNTGKAQNDPDFSGAGLFSYSCYPLYFSFDQKRISSWVMPTNEWHQISLVSDGLGLIKHYIDGNLINSSQFVYSRFYYDYLRYSNIYLNGYFYLGGLGTTEFAEVKFYSKALNATQIMNDCLNYSPYLDGANCGADSTSLTLEIPETVPVNTCIPLEYYYQHPLGDLRPPLENKMISFESSSDVSFFNSSSCALGAKVNSVSYLLSDTGKKHYYMKINSTGSKTILVKSEKNKLLRKFTTNAIKIPASISAGFSPDPCYTGNVLIIDLLNEDNEGSLFIEDAMVTITASTGMVVSKIIPKYNYSYSVNLSAEPGFNNTNISSISISVSAANFTKSMSLPYEIPGCGGD